MDLLASVRAKLQAGKAKQVIPQDAPVPPPKLFPLRNQDQNRLVQVMHRESFSASDIYTTKLHRGILNDWLGGFEVDGVISLLPSAILSIANAALWNSRARFEATCTATSPPGSFMASEFGGMKAQDVQRLCLVDFSVMIEDLAVLDTRQAGIPQSHATCIQTVLGDNLLVAVYHKLRDGSVRQIAKATIADITTCSSALLASTKFVSTFDVTPFEKLRHCYDLPPSLVENLLQRAAGQAACQGRAIKLSGAPCYWVNNQNLSALWGSGRRAELHSAVSTDGETLAVALLSVGTGAFLGRVSLYAEFALSADSAHQPPVACNPTAGTMLELSSAWVRDPQDNPSSLPAAAVLAETDRLLLVGGAAECAALKALFPERTVACELVPSLHDPVAEGASESGSAESKTGDSLYGTAVVLLPSSPREGEQVNLVRVLDLLRDFCQRASRLIVLSFEGAAADAPAASPTSASPLAEVFAGAMITAQLEFLKCSLCLCRVATASKEGSSERAVVAHQVLQQEGQGQELEVCYHHTAGATLKRLVRRYSPVPQSPTAPLKSTDAVINSEDVYIITGGLGGLGLLTALCLVEQGARKLVLVSRSGKVPYQGQGLEDQLRALTESPGMTVRLAQCDVSAEDQVVRMLSQARELGSLGGIIHAAGVLSDGLIVTGKASQGASAVWDAKAKSAYLLHKHTSADTHIKLFLTYSSVTSAVGTAGQSAYAGANRYLEWLVQERVRTGQAGLCIRWPEVTGVGMAAALHGSSGGDDASTDRTCAISAAQARAFLHSLLRRTSQGHVNAAVVTLMPPALMELYSPAVIGKQFASLSLPQVGPVPLSAVVTATAETSVPATPLLTEAQVRGSVHRILSALLEDGSNGELRDDALLMQTGLDSLGATELSAQLSSEFGLKVPPTLIFNFPTVKEIVGYILAALAARSNSTTASRLVTRTSPMVAPPAEMQTAVTGSGAVTLDEVAIIGTSLSFPGNCSSLSRLWDILLSKESTSVLTPADRWDVDALLAANRIRDPGCKARLQSAHFLTHEEPFNCQQFNVTAKEAAVMHPSHKLLLINCLRALEDAGYAEDKLCVNTGVYVGIGGVVSGTGSAAATAAAGDEKSPSAATKMPTMSAYSATSHSVSVSAGRISFSLGLSGPCMAIDTACSSSLVALHAARRALQLGECDLALVCGVNCLDPSSSLACAVAGMTSPDGVCRTFDAQANGYSRAEGCGVIVLKRLSDAVRDADAVYSVVKGSAVKQDGKSASLTAPNGKAQQDLLLSALRDARLQSGNVSLLETHGTGTKLGDPVEMAALSAVFGERPSAERPLYLTAVKANVGHLEAGAGMAGLFSILLALQHRTAPPNALLKTLNEDVRTAIGDASMVPITAPTPLEVAGARPLVAGVSSFGYSGTIAHVLLQEAPVGVRRRGVTASATSASSCDESLVHPATANAAPSGETVGDGEAAEGWDASESEGEEEEDASAHDQVWQFSGQGDMRVGAGKDLWDTEETFRSAMTECDRIVRPLLGKAISELLYPPGCVAAKPSPANTAPAVKSPAVLAAEALMAQTMYSQTALVALEYSLAAVWLAQGVQPDIVLGHSLGEYAAAVVAGVLTLKDALTLVSERGRLVQENAGCQGVMYAVRTTAEDVAAALNKADARTLSAASVAACNGKLSYVLSGSEAAVKQLIALLPRTGSIRLGVSHAFHSPLMQCIAEPFRRVLEKVRFSPLREGVTFVSTVRGRAVSSAELADPQYWIDHMLLPVQFTTAVECAWRAGGSTYLEMGPQDTLTKLAVRALEAVAKEASSEGRSFETMASLC